MKAKGWGEIVVYGGRDVRGPCEKPSAAPVWIPGACWLKVQIHPRPTQSASTESWQGVGLAHLQSGWPSQPLGYLQPY